MLQEISLFETNIRIVGGLLSAYDLSGDKVGAGPEPFRGRTYLRSAAGDEQVSVWSQGVHVPSQAFLRRATELVDLMLPAMDGMPTGWSICASCDALLRQLLTP